MACQITYNDNNTLEVKSNNGKSSILFDQIKNLPEIESDYEALNSWLKVYTKTFKEWFGTDWENISAAEVKELQKNGYLDNNGEPAILYRGTYEGEESFNYSDTVGKFGQGIYLTSSLNQAESFVNKSNKQVYPVFIRPGKSVNFESVTKFKETVAEFNNIKTVPSESQIEGYVNTQHDNDVTIIGKGLMGKEYNIPKSEYVKSIFSKGFTVNSKYLFEDTDQFDITNEDEQQVIKSDAFINELVDRLSKNLKMEDSYSIITEEEAAFITRKAKNPWRSGRPAFFFNGKVYFIEGQLTYETAFHEFSHPLIEALFEKNPKLFYRIYEDLIADSKGKEFLIEAIDENSELSPNHSQIKKEVLVKAMTFSAKSEGLLDIEKEPSGVLAKIIKKILYAIKQIFRKLSKTSKVEKLSPNTTVKELSEMLLNKTWGINMTTISKDDIVAYINDVSKLGTLQDRIDSFDPAKEKREHFNNIFSIIEQQSQLLLTQKININEATNKKDIEIILSDITGISLNLIMEQNINQGTVSTKKRAQAAIAGQILEKDNFKDRITALAVNLDHIESSVRKMKEHIKLLRNDPDEQEALQILDFYVKNMRQWDSHLDYFLKMAEESNIDMDSSLIEDVRSIKGSIQTGQQNIHTIQKQSLASALTPMMDNSNKLMQEALDKEIAFYKKRLAALSGKPKTKLEIESIILQKEEDKINKLIDVNKMMDFLTGKLGDVGWLSANFENFLAMQDSSISSFALYIKKHLSKVQTKTHQRVNSFLTELQPLLKELGMSPKQLNKFSKEFIFMDKGYKKNEDTLEIEEHDILTFLNEYQNYKYTLTKIDDELSRAYENWENDESDEKLKAAAELQRLKDNHIKYFFKQRFVDKYYEADDVLNSNPLGALAKIKVDGIMKNIMLYQSEHSDPSIVYEDYRIAETMWRDYKQQFSTYNLDGEKKEGDALKMAEILQEWRENKRKFYDYTLKPGIFQKTYKHMKIKLDLELVRDNFTEGTREYDEEFERRRKIWVEANTSIKPTDKFYLDRQDILDDISEIMAIDRENKISVIQEALLEEGLSEKEINKLNAKLKRLESNISDIESLLDSLQGTRDGDGQPIGTEMSKKHLAAIADAEEELLLAKADIEGTGGLTPNEWKEMNIFWDKIYEQKIKLSKSENIRFKKLNTKKAKGSLNKTLKDQLRNAFDKLKNLQKRQATTYYIDVINDFYRDIKKEEGESVPKTFTLQDIEDFEDISFVDNLTKKSKKFKEWFEANHIVKTITNERTGEEEKYYNRTLAWSVVRPLDPKHMESIEVENEDGTIEVLQGTPGIKFMERVVKPEYQAGYDKSTGEVDPNAFLNNQRKNLPKSLKEMELVRNKYQKELDELNIGLEKLFGKKFTWDHYINREYLELKKENGAKFKILELFKKLNKESQEGLEWYAKLDDEMPRFRKEAYEYLTVDKKNIKGKGRELMAGVMETFGKKKDDHNEGELNFDMMNAYLEADMFAGDESKVPIRGTPSLDEKQVSRDITGSLFKYYLSAEQNKELRKMQPIANAMKALATNNNITPLKEVLKAKSLTRAAKAQLKGEVNHRKEVITGMIEMLFEGKKLTSGSNEWATTNKVINNMLGLAAHTFFAFDMTSALKNWAGAKWQMKLESYHGRYFGWSAWAKARYWSGPAMSSISAQIYSTGPKSLKVQMIEIFDAIQGRFEEKFGESVSRSALRDAAGGTWTTSHRKWLETEATLQLFAAIMYETQVEQIQDGKVVKIPYIKAWEINKETGQIQLLEGIDKKWDINGEEFENVKIKNHEVSNLLQGAYAGADQPIISRYMGFRMVSSMKKYFTKMFLHRYGHGGMKWEKGKGLVLNERVNAALGNSHLGFYWQNAATMSSWAVTGGRSLLYTSPKQWKAMLHGALELLRLQVFTMLWQYAFSFDPDDKDKWTKMKKRSGAMTSTFVDKEWSKGFNYKGWLANHAVMLAISSETEFRHFIPAPGYGLKDLYNTVLGDLSVSAGGSAKLIANTGIGMIGAALSDSDAKPGDPGYSKSMYYKSNKGGAFNVHQEGEAKFWLTLYKLIGIKEKTFDPTTGTKNLFSNSDDPFIK